MTWQPGFGRKASTEGDPDDGWYHGVVSIPARLNEAAERRFWQGAEHAERFFMGEADVQRALDALVRRSTPTGFPTPSSARWH